MGKKSPKTPDAMQTANQQYSMNKQAAQDNLRMNAMDQTNAFGSSTFTRDANGNPTGINTQFTGDMKTGFDNLGGAYANYTSQLPQEAFDSTKIAQTDELAKAYYQKGSDLLQDDFGQARNAQDVQLTNRGLPIGSEARNIAEGNLAKQQSLALSTLAKDATLLSPQEQQRLINNARQDYGMKFDNANQTLGMLSGMRSLAPQANQPTANAQAGDYQGAAWQNYQAQQNAYNNKMAGYGSLLKTGLGLALSPVTGGLSNTLLGSMFRGGGGGGGGTGAAYGSYRAAQE